MVTGASDCASCVGVLLELARVLVADPTIKLSAPVVFLFNGAEETFLQARCQQVLLHLIIGDRICDIAASHAK